MPRKSVLTPSQKVSLLSFPTSKIEFERYYTLSENDLFIIHQKREIHNRLGFALMLCCIRYPGISYDVDTVIEDNMMEFVKKQLSIQTEIDMQLYFKRETTRREQLAEIQNLYGYRSLNAKMHASYVELLLPTAKATDNGAIVANKLIELLRHEMIIVPNISVIERLCSEAITIATKWVYETLLEQCSKMQLDKLQKLFTSKPNTNISYLGWLQMRNFVANPKFILEHIQRLRFIKELDLPKNIEFSIHSNRLIKLAKEGKNLSSFDIARFETKRKNATIIAIVVDIKGSIIDDIIELNDKILSIIFNKAKNSHKNKFQDSSKTINEKLGLYYKIGQALIKAKQTNQNPYEAIEEFISWEEFEKSLVETKSLSKSENFDFLYRLSLYNGWFKKYIYHFYETIDLKASPNTQNILEAIKILQTLHKNNQRKMPSNAPTDFIKSRWNSVVFKNDGQIDKIFYEFAVASELKNVLRSGDLWVSGSKQYKDFEEYLIDPKTYKECLSNEILLGVTSYDFKEWIAQKTDTLTTLLTQVNQEAKENRLIDAIINEKGLKISPLTASVPEEARNFIQKVYAMLPKTKVTALLQEVDEWISFSDSFTHLKTRNIAENKQLLLSVILADAINLGLSKMAEATPDTTYSKLASIQGWHIRQETYKDAQAQLTNAIHEQPITKYWGDGSSSSSDGQRFKTGGINQLSANINPKYGNDPGMIYYSHTSDKYAPFSMQLITSNVRDSTYVLDGLLHHEADLNITEHYTDTAGFTDHVFAMMNFQGFKFAPRIRDLKDKKLYPLSKDVIYENLSSIIGGTVNTQLIENNWEEILRLMFSIKKGVVPSSLIIKKLGSYPRQNSLATAIREIGKIERTIFTLEWIRDPNLRRRVHTGLNKGEAKHALTRAIHFNRLGEIRDKTYQNQLYKASGLNLVASAIILWNTVYIEKAVNYLRQTDENFNEELISNLSPLGWEHINLTGDYTWVKKVLPLALRI